MHMLQTNEVYARLCITLKFFLFYLKRINTRPRYTHMRAKFAQMVSTEVNLRLHSVVIVEMLLGMVRRSVQLNEL